MEKEITVGKLRGGEKFLVLPHEGYRFHLYGDFTRGNWQLFVKLGRPFGRQRMNVVRLRDGELFAIENSVPVIRVR